MNSDFYRRSVDSLQRIYAIIVALAITHAISVVFLDNGQLGNRQDIIKYLPQFFTFSIIIVPFFHGMNRHLDRCYIEKGSKPLNFALLIDFVIFFVESMILFALAGTLKSPELNYVIVLVILLGFDTIWGFVSHCIHYRKFEGPIIWGIINLISIIIILLIFFFKFFNIDKTWLVFIIAAARTIADYIFCWHFYFPDTTQ
jgi:hypothetical protein